MIFISFNVNGIRSAIKNGLLEFITSANADVILLQETKINKPIDLQLSAYKCIWSFSTKIGYAGTAILFKHPPINIKYGMGNNDFNDEGRIITLEYPSFFLINIYTPNSRGPLDRWYYRLDWEENLFKYIFELSQQKSIILGGDFNVAHSSIDIYPESSDNIKNKNGFSEEERGALDNLLNLDLIDSFRFMHPTQKNIYTWWRTNNIAANKGRRIDYFLISKTLQSYIIDSAIMPPSSISDHSPIKLIMNSKNL